MPIDVKETVRPIILQSTPECILIIHPGPFFFVRLFFIECHLRSLRVPAEDAGARTAYRKRGKVEVEVVVLVGRESSFDLEASSSTSSSSRVDGTRHHAVRCVR